MSNNDQNQPQSAASFQVNWSEFGVRLMKYLLEGFVVAVAAYLIPSNDGLNNKQLQKVVMLGLVAAMTFSILDLFAPSVGSSLRTGSGFSLGSGLVGGFGKGAPTGLMGQKF
jgi:ABC-type Co2+ transport system permease subunit